MAMGNLLSAPIMLNVVDEVTRMHQIVEKLIKNEEIPLRPITSSKSVNDL